MLKLDHVALRVADLDRALGFYTENLGLELLFRKVDPAHHEAFAFLKLEGGNLELLQKLDQEGRPRPYPVPPVEEPFCPHIALATRDIDQLVHRFQRDGIPIVKGPLEIAEMVRWVYIHDPDHNIIEFVQWLQRSGPIDLGW